MGPFGTSEMIIVAVVLLLLFGAKRMPEMARGLGQSLKIFKTEMSSKPADSDAANAVIVNPAPADTQAQAAETAAEAAPTPSPADPQARPAT